MELEPGNPGISYPYSKNLPFLENDTQNVIEYVKQTNKKKKKKFNFWKLLEND